ncbi:hypothetical protein ACHAQH_007468 [Verticillium albo-atrum]
MHVSRLSATRARLSSALPCRQSYGRLSAPSYRALSHLSTSRSNIVRNGLTTRSSAATRLYSTAPYAGAPGLKDFLRISDEVAEAIATNKPVVALESTIYTHGALGNDLGLEDIVRQGGGIPAVCGILDGVPVVGLTPEEVARMVDSGNARKCSRRDIAYLAGLGLAGKKVHGGTTIAGTMLLARLAGIRVFGTGGLGGVHRGGHDSMDVSADLTELGRTRVAVVSSGCKGFLDIPRTLEFLETHGAFVATFADGRTGPIDFPAFWARTSGTPSPLVVENEKDAAAMILAQETMGIESGMVFANPIPQKDAVPAAEMAAVIETAVREANEKGFTGARNTPYVLTAIREQTGERSTLANKALVRSNVARAATIAVELSKLQSGTPSLTAAPSSNNCISGIDKPSPPKQAVPAPAPSVPTKVDVLVAGSVALDLSCDYAPTTKLTNPSPKLETSNPAAISQSIGGVGHNVALAAHRATKSSLVRLCSLVGADPAGDTVLTALASEGLDTSAIRQLPAPHRTAQYVAVNDASKNLVVAMADMDILSANAVPASQWRAAVKAASPSWVVVDANWAPRDIHTWLAAGRAAKAKIAYEPVSTVKSTALFPPETELDVFPYAAVDLASPNTYELEAMWTAARENGHLATQGWWTVVDAFGLFGARDAFVRLVGVELADAGVPVQAVQLLPYIPTVVTKLGAKGCLLTTILGRDDPRLSDPREEKYILSRSKNGNPEVGGVYMRMFPAAERVDEIVSVNGVGDTFLGVMVAGLAMGGRVEGLIGVAQEGAVLTLKSKEAVSPELGSLEESLKDAVDASRRA